MPARKRRRKLTPIPFPTFRLPASDVLARVRAIAARAEWRALAMQRWEAKRREAA